MRWSPTRLTIGIVLGIIALQYKIGQQGLPIFSLFNELSSSTTDIQPTIIQSVYSAILASQQLFTGLLHLIGESLGQFVTEPDSVWSSDAEYDFVVVGAGTGGAVVANRLSENQEWTVLLLEAGGHEHFIMDLPLTANYLQFTWANWNYKTEPSPRYCKGMVEGRCNFPRGKVMGGSSTLNYMIYTRGNWRDYDNWERQGNPGWGFKDLLPYWRRIETFDLPEGFDEGYHGRDGYLNVGYAQHQTKIATAFVTACTEFGMNYTDYNGRYQQGVSRLHITTKDGLRHSSNKAYLFPIRNRPNLHVKKHSLVTRIEINPITKAAQGVYYTSGFPLQRETYIQARREVIISAGAINTPQLLMLSGIGPKEHLETLGIPVVNDLKVGFGLQDHVATGGLTFLVNETSLNTMRLAMGPELPEYLNKHSGPLGIPGGCEVVTFNAVKELDDPDAWPDVELLMIGGSMTSDGSLYKGFGIQEELYDRVYRPIQDKDTFMVFPMLMRPKSKGRIMLQSRDPLDHPLIFPNYFAFEQDMSTILEGIKLLLRIIEQPALRKMNARLHDIPLLACATLPFASERYFQCMTEQLTFNVYHQCGTARMGPATDAFSVVDARLRVHGVKGLRVIDASVIPEIPAGHTNGVVYVIAEKGSGMVKEDWGRAAAAGGREATVVRGVGDVRRSLLMSYVREMLMGGKR